MFSLDCVVFGCELQLKKMHSNACALLRFTVIQGRFLSAVLVSVAGWGFEIVALSVGLLCFHAASFFSNEQHVISVKQSWQPHFCSSNLPPEKKKKTVRQIGNGNLSLFVGSYAEATRKVTMVILRPIAHELNNQPSGLVGRHWAKLAWCVRYWSPACVSKRLPLAAFSTSLIRYCTPEWVNH